ncbi:methyltransferase-like protein 22 [Ochlerotatus camptorhynchus]|uniref:methyltransferase-like protein 22 n=1 Tax=Ochlerotatus camptorhynchus TaxID=644619 RepID=UPI0031D27939
MATFEVCSELYAETDFSTTDTTNGNSISKFTFIYPKENEKCKGGKQIVCSVEEEGIKLNFNGSGLNGADNHSNSHSNGTQRITLNDIKNASFDDCLADGNSVSKDSIETDKDGDLIVERRKKGVIEIEHLKSTKLDLVGLQIWRGALLLADYILHNEKKFKNRKILELGSGVGLTSIVSSLYAREVVCTDINVGGLLELIQANITRNSNLKNPSCNVVVTELDFKVQYAKYSDELKAQLQDVEYVIAADVIYDDDITEAFVVTLENLLLELPKLKGVYIALEKRYVFTVEDMDSVAPSYEHFLRVFYRRNNRFGITRWKLMQIPLNFPRYFEYEKIKDLVLLKISN